MRSFSGPGKVVQEETPQGVLLPPEKKTHGIMQTPCEMV